MICGQCGDPLIKKPLINPRQLFGFVTAAAFLIPLLFMVFFVIKDFTKDKVPKESQPFVLLTTKN